MRMALSQFGVHYYTLEMKGDTMINGKAYKPVHLYSGESIDESNDTVPVYLREEDKVVYGIIPDERRYWECPVGIGTMVENCRFACDNIKAGEEFKLYDFNDPANFYENEVTTWMSPLHYNYADTVQVGDRLSKRHSISFNSIADHEEFIIDGIGYVGNDDYLPLGTPLNYFYPVSSGMTQVDYRLSHVIEDGKIIYKGMRYRECALDGIDEVVADRAVRPIDGNYYNLMGQPVGTQVPSVPGIYIHQGKKIVVR